MEDRKSKVSIVLTTCYGGILGIHEGTVQPTAEDPTCWILKGDTLSQVRDKVIMIQEVQVRIIFDGGALAAERKGGKA